MIAAAVLQNRIGLAFIRGTARFKRWIYLMFIGGWRDEHAIDGYDADGLKVIGSGRRYGENRTEFFRIWWAREEVELL